MISIECFKGLPIEYESFIIEKYNSFITTCRYIEIYCTNYDINYMLVYKNNVLIEVLIFGNRGCTTTCFNSLVEIDQSIIKEFTRNIFEKYSFIEKIKIVASYKNYSLKKSILFSMSDDNILNLPSTMDDYYSELGSSTRQHIKNRKVRLLRDYSDVIFVTKFGNEIDEIIIDKIIQLNSDRMKLKGKKSGIDNSYKNRIYKYSQHYGCVSYLEIDGEIVAGCISTILNKGIFIHVIAYDHNFSKNNVGEICVFYLLQTSIEKEISTIHFLWGENELKKRFLAQPHELFSYYIFRKYSIEYIFSKVNFIFTSIFISFQHSKFSVPFRNAIRYYRRRKWKV